MTLDEKRKLFADGCRLVVHLSAVINQSFGQIGKLADACDNWMLDAQLATIDNFMNGLGDLMNNHDLVDNAEDEWGDDVFDRMREWKQAV